MTDTNPYKPRWLSVEQIRKQQRMGRQTVIDAMDKGDLAFEQRGRVRYARQEDIDAWEEKRLTHQTEDSVELDVGLAAYT